MLIDLLSRICRAFILMALLVGVAFFPIAPTNENVTISVDDEIISTGAQTSETVQVIDDAPVLFRATGFNWDLVNIQDEFLSEWTYRIGYNGDLFYIETYNLAGNKEPVTAKISEEDLAFIKNILDGSFQDETENRDASDGTGWNMTYFSPDGETIHEFHGYIYGSEKEEIIRILDEYIK